jgi:zinc transporter ZupT
MPNAILIALVVTAVLAVAGAALGIALGRMQRAQLEILVHVATGTLLGITAFDILPEAKAVLTWPVFIVATVLGYALLWAVGRFVFYVCPSCAIASHEEEDLRKRGSLILLAAALGIHCVLDGLAMSSGNHLSARAENGAIVAVALHKIPEGLALGLLLVGARYSHRAALAISAGIESLTVLGGAIGLLFLANPAPLAVGIVFAFVGGGFVYLVTNAFGGALLHSDVLPSRKWITAEALSFVATGIALMLAASR